MHIDRITRRAYNIEPNMCWECYSCVKACPQNAIDVRGYADFAPLGHSVRVLREEAKATVSWKLKFRDGREKSFESPIRTTPWGSIKGPAEYDAPRPQDFASQELAHEPDGLKIAGGLPALRPDHLKQGVVWWGLGRKPYSLTDTVIGCDYYGRPPLLGTRPRSSASRKRTSSAAAPSRGLYAIKRMGMQWARTRTMSAMPATTSWVWCARVGLRHRPACGRRCTS
jgi:adenylylsulfate reductase subunit B